MFGTDQFVDGLSFYVLMRTIGDLGIDANGIYDKREAVKRIGRHLRKIGLKIEYECGRCGGHIPDVERCFYCGDIMADPDADYKKHGIPQARYHGARRGLIKAGVPRVSGEVLFYHLTKKLGIPKKYIRYGRSITSLRNKYGLYARCAIGTRSVRVLLPFDVGQFRDNFGVLVPLKRPAHNMLSRMSIEFVSEIPMIVPILRQSSVMKERKVRECRKKSRESQKRKKASERKFPLVRL